ncbi:hypothetical protein G5B40_17090 [Pikeienuella piscinae]|uniref:UDP-N-acetylglucosamine 2-epimerase domain-containing protein n=1 Tax=Pikeienuella piscinae TaxID=2748098 RepID=A0A7L5BZ38_9RHOB|nr:UDP-N-acetylglucosamine 2-epimerase [Pikeienuella piscinae]QIE57002.1 hypothetical protein G5B40_17090 [Pikeienuella piscinae]
MPNEICVIVGTRPGIIMMAPIIHALQAADHPHYVIHTGQHYSPEMDVELFEDLGLTVPVYHLKGAAEAQTHATKTARMMEGCEAAFLERRPGVVLVNGDANSNVAAALADWTPVFGDGRAAERIVAHCALLLEEGIPS